MAGSRKRNTGSQKRGGSTRRSGASSGGGERPASEYAREAAAEWGKAVRYAAAALRPSNPPRLKALLPKRSARAGRLGDAADTVLSKMGKPGKAASKLGVGSRLVDRMTAPPATLERLSPREQRELFRILTRLLE